MAPSMADMRSADSIVGPVYSATEKYFTIQMHYNGRMIYLIDGQPHYAQGEIHFWDRVDPDCLSMFDLDSFLVQAGYLESLGVQSLEAYREKEDYSYFWRTKNGLLELCSDEDVLAMAGDVVNGTKYVHIFLMKRSEFQQPIDPPTEAIQDSQHSKEARSKKQKKQRVDKQRGNGSKRKTTREKQREEGEATDSSVTSGFREDGDEFSEEDLNDYNTQNNVGANVGRVASVRDELHINADIDGDWNSDYGESDELESIYSSDENGEVERPRFPIFNAEKELQNPTFCKYLTFTSFDILKEAIQNYSLNNKKQIRFKKSDKTRLYAVCQRGCPWRIWASPSQDGRIQIKGIEMKHEGCSVHFKNKFGDHNFIAKKYLSRFQADENWSTKSIMQTVREDMHMEIKDRKARRARHAAIKMIRGLEVDQYKRLHDYCDEVRRSNVGSTIFVETNEDTVFRRMYCCLGACKEGFLAGCRKVIGVDGCFLKTEHEGQLLSAIGIDANNGMFPIAYAMVKSENEDNWTWFLQTLARDLHINDDPSSWMFMADKQKGLMNAMRSVFPDAEHRCCVRHLWTNLQRALGGTQTTKETLWLAARASYLAEFETHMNALRVTNERAYSWLVEKPFSQWSRCYFRMACKSDLLLNNHCEAWNKCILGARAKPVISMFETLRSFLMERFRVKDGFAIRNWKGPLCPRIQEKLDLAKKASFYCFAVPNGELCFEVNVQGSRFVVDLKNWTCTCRMWELSGIPCSHAICCIFQIQDTPERYVDKCFEVATYIKSYSFHVCPMVGHESWERGAGGEVLPWHVTIDKTRKGRRATTRKKGPEEIYSRKATSGRVSKKGTSISCGKCGKSGHNKRSCKEVAVTEGDGHEATDVATETDGGGP